MILQTGPRKKVAFKNALQEKIKRLRSVYILLLIGLPILVFQSFKLNWVSYRPAAGDEILSAVGLVKTGTGTGSAFLVSPTKLVTARHVVGNLQLGDVIKVEFVKADLLENEVDAKVLFISQSEARYNDYALLELLKPIVLNPLEIGSAEESIIGNEIAVIGYPFGSFSSTKGSISNDAAFENESVLQLYAGAWPGNSGGPVIDKQSSKVIGILLSGFEGEGKGITFAVKIDQLINDEQLQEQKIDLLK
jgi:S1-C subfamily serine protease